MNNPLSVQLIEFYLNENVDDLSKNMIAIILW